MVLSDIADEHLDEAALLAFRRMRLLDVDNLGLGALARRDERLAAHIDGLQIAIEAGWEADWTSRVEGLFAAGGRFVRTVVALQLGDEVPGIDEEGDADEQLALGAALGWVSRSSLRGVVVELLGTRSTRKRALGFRACAQHAVDPGQALSPDVFDDEDEVALAAAAAAAAAARTDLAQALLKAGLRRKDARAAAGLIGPAVLLGAHDGAARLGDRLAADGECSPWWPLAFRSLALTDAHALVVAGAAKRPRERLRAAAAIGDPRYVPWMLDKMRDPPLARVAGEAFATICGVDIASGLDASAPEAAEREGATEVDPDEGLPWPDPEKCAAWWHANRVGLREGERYFMGAPPARAHCIEVLRRGAHRQRIAAAEYLCLLAPGAPRFNASAPAWRQKRRLERLV